MDEEREFRARWDYLCGRTREWEVPDPHFRLVAELRVAQARAVESLAEVGRRPRAVLYERQAGPGLPARCFAAGAAHAEAQGWEVTRYRFADGPPPDGLTGWTQARALLRKGLADAIVTTSLGTLTTAEPVGLHELIAHMRLLGRFFAVVHPGVRTHL